MQIAHLEFQLEDSIPTQRVLRMRVGAGDVRIFMDRVASKIRPDVAVPGFRKGKGPLFLVRKHHAGRVAAESLDTLKRAALEQVMQQLKDEDKPFIPPELVDSNKVRVRYGQPLEFALRYLIDPSGIGKHPEAKPDEFDPLSGVYSQPVRSLPMGVPEGPRMPSVPSARTEPPTLPS